MWQGCPANYYLPSFDKFANRNKKKFVFYARPNNPRNCYAFAMYLIIQAINENLFDETAKTRLPKVPIRNFGWIAKKTRSGILSVATRRVTTEKLPILDFCKTSKE